MQRMKFSEGVAPPDSSIEILPEFLTFRVSTAVLPLTWISSQPACPTDFRLASSHNPVGAILSLSLYHCLNLYHISISLSCYFYHLYLHLCVSPVVLFLWRILIIEEPNKINEGKYQILNDLPVIITMKPLRKTHNQIWPS